MITSGSCPRPHLPHHRRVTVPTRRSPRLAEALPSGLVRVLGERSWPGCKARVVAIGRASRVENGLKRGADLIEGWLPLSLPSSMGRIGLDIADRIGRGKESR